MNSNFKSFEEWKKTFPRDYIYAKNKKMLPFIFHKMGWELPTHPLLEIFNEIKETKLKEVYNIFLDVEKEMNVIKNKNNKASEVRFRGNVRTLAKKLKTIKTEISLLKL